MTCGAVVKVALILVLVALNCDSYRFPPSMTKRIIANDIGYME